MYAVLIAVAIFLVLFFTLSWWLPKTWYRKLLYTGGRPNWLSKPLNAGSGWIFALGILPPFLLSLETKGRVSGRSFRIPLVAAEVGGELYLVSMLGENADWVKNARAAGGEAVLHHGTAQRIRLEDVPVAQRPPILKEYLRRAPGARPHFDIAWTAPAREFEPIAARYPVFRIVRH
jgi:F420H(2)-dependent quinone reductase